MYNIVLCGFMGCGKTSVGKELAKEINYGFIDTDELIEKEQKITINEIFEIYGESCFRELEHEACKKVANMKNCIISTGGGTMTYERNVNAIKNGSKVFFLNSSFSVICKRIGDNNTRPLFKDIEKAKKLYDERQKKYYDVADYVVDGDRSIEETVLIITDILRKSAN